MLCGTERKEVLERLNILNTSNDGFYIANEDLKGIVSDSDIRELVYAFRD